MKFHSHVWFSWNWQFTWSIEEGTCLLADGGPAFLTRSCFACRRCCCSCCSWYCWILRISSSLCGKDRRWCHAVFKHLQWLSLWRADFKQFETAHIVHLSDGQRWKTSKRPTLRRQSSCKFRRLNDCFTPWSTTRSHSSCNKYFHTQKNPFKSLLLYLGACRIKRNHVPPS